MLRVDLTVSNSSFARLQGATMDGLMKCMDKAFLNFQE